jgi:hypothetical protein
MMEQSPADYKGKLSLIKKRREQGTIHNPSVPSALIDSSAAGFGDDVTVAQERKSKSMVSSDEKRKKMDEMKERCHSTNLTERPSKNQSETGVAVVATRRPSGELSQKKNSSKEAAPPSNFKLAIQWTCDECHHTCIPVRSESRCLW